MWKDKALEYIDKNSDHLIEISDEIHRNPEIAFKEVKASRLLSDELKKAGFKVELGAAGMWINEEGVTWKTDLYGYTC
jgi:metal-dependent amidase/aminoacylase/carboxypeptidase family protein